MFEFVPLVLQSKQLINRNIIHQTYYKISKSSSVIYVGAAALLCKYSADAVITRGLGRAAPPHADKDFARNVSF